MALDSTPAKDQGDTTRDTMHETNTNTKDCSQQLLNDAQKGAQSQMQNPARDAEANKLGLPNLKIENNPPGSPTFDDPSRHGEEACMQVKTNQSLTPHAREEFEKSIALADGLNHDAVQQTFDKLAAKLDAEVSPNIKAEYIGDQQELGTAMQAMTPEAQQKFGNLMEQLSESRDPKEQNRIKEGMKDTSKVAFDAQQKMEKLIAPYQTDIDQANQYSRLSNAGVDSRLNYIRALKQFGSEGDQDKAKQLTEKTEALIESYSKSPEEAKVHVRMFEKATALPF